MDVYLHLDSSQCLDIYPDNRPWSFKIQFNAPLDLSGLWTIALTEIHLDGNFARSPLDIFCNLCAVSIVGGVKLPILRRIFHSDQLFSIPYYKKVSLQETNSIEIDIRTSKGETALLLKGPTFVTLHLKRYPFLRL